MHKITLYELDGFSTTYKEVPEYNIYENFLHFVDEDGKEHSTTLPYHIQVCYYKEPEPVVKEVTRVTKVDSNDEIISDDYYIDEDGHGNLEPYFSEGYPDSHEEVRKWNSEPVGTPKVMKCPVPFVDIKEKIEDEDDIEKFVETSIEGWLSSFNQLNNYLKELDEKRRKED